VELLAAHGASLPEGEQQLLSASLVAALSAVGPHWPALLAAGEAKPIADLAAVLQKIGRALGVAPELLSTLVPTHGGSRSTFPFEH
jgi:hypothetical protein